MPHLIIETTKPIDKNVVKALHDELCEQNTVKPETVKTRLVGSLVHFMADGSSNDHVHITVKLLPGRDADLKKAISSNIHKKAIELLNAPVSVDVVDLGAYTK